MSLYSAARLKERLGHPGQDVIDAYLRAAEAAPRRVRRCTARVDSADIRSGTRTDTDRKTRAQDPYAHVQFVICRTLDL